MLFITGCGGYVMAPEDAGRKEIIEIGEITAVNTRQAEQRPEESKKAELDETETKNSETETKTTEERKEQKSAYTPAVTQQKEEEFKEKDTCGCSLRWDPVCGIDDKIYINPCIFQCMGNTLNLIKTNSQCPKKELPPKIYVDDVEIEYEPDKWYGGYCWRDMWRDEGLRRCKNIIVNGRVNQEPAPQKGNWLDNKHIVLDKNGRKDSYTIKLNAGEKASNEEYNKDFQPLFETGDYKLSFWARQDVAANNDWQVKFSVRDWPADNTGSERIDGCYEFLTEINGNEHFIDEEPNKWRHYHYKFHIPLNASEWDKTTREAAYCDYDWNNIPGGYRIEVTGASFGEAWFDDFSLIKEE
jgi:hypothetical protein